MPNQKVTIKVGQILQDPPNGLRYVLQVLDKEPLRFQYSRPISKLREVIEKEFAICSEERLKLIKQYGMPAKPCKTCKTTGKVSPTPEVESDVLADCTDCMGKGFIRDENSQQWQANPAICGEKWKEFMDKYNEFILSDVEMDAAPIIEIPASFDIPGERIRPLAPFFAPETDAVTEAEKIVKHG